ncbi:hypothetical protein [Halosegnis longus]|uniref:hypothetical protein n=1 Tax=Halosegnis longus TaxID=2216012 RepID=UPI0011CE28AB
MVTVSVDNDPVSVPLASEESVTVPSGETWVVEVTAINDGSGYDARVKLNGVSVIGAPNAEETTASMTLTAGDTIEPGRRTAGGSVTGWSV